MAPFMVDNREKLEALLEHISNRTSKECLLFLDLEGIDLGRYGSIAIMQLMIPPEPIVYLIDVYVLGPMAFNTRANTGCSLKSILEDASITKVFFDIRNDSDALHAHFGVKVAGIIDLQLLEYLRRQEPGQFVNGLARCIESVLPDSSTWLATKRRGHHLFSPEEGGSYDVFHQRPLPQNLIDYCEQDVLVLPRLLLHYSKNLSPEVIKQLAFAIHERIELSQSHDYNGKGCHMALAPCFDQHNPWADRATPETDVLISPHLSNLCKTSDDLLTDLLAVFNSLKPEPESNVPSSTRWRPFDWDRCKCSRCWDESVDQSGWTLEAFKLWPGLMRILEQGHDQKASEGW